MPISCATLPTSGFYGWAPTGRWGRSAAEGWLASTPVARLRAPFYPVAPPPRHPQPRLSRSLERHGEATLIVPPRDCAALDRLAGDDQPMQRLIDQAKRLGNEKLDILLPRGT